MKTSNLFLCQPSSVRKPSTSESFLLDVCKMSAGSQTKKTNAQATSKQHSQRDLHGSQSTGTAQPTPSLLKKQLSGCLLSATFAARCSAFSSSKICSAAQANGVVLGKVGHRPALYNICFGGRHHAAFLSVSVVRFGILFRIFRK